MNLIKVNKSSHIKAIGWEAKFVYNKTKPPKDTLRIAFNNDQIYDYLDVTEKTFKDFINADSKGGFFERKIKDRYTTLKRRIKYAE